MKTNVLIKVLIVSIILTIISTTNSNAQSGFNFKLNLIGQNSWMINSDDYDDANFEYKALILPAFGLGVGYNFTDQIGLGLDFNYSLQGQKAIINEVENTIRLDYLKIPLYFQYTSNTSSPVMFTTQIGPQIGILTDARLLDEDGEEINDDLKDMYMDVTFGAFVGAGAEFALSDNFHLYCIARYDIDFTNAEDEDYSDYVSGREITLNSTLGLQFGLKYFLGK